LPFFNTQARRKYVRIAKRILQGIGIGTGIIILYLLIITFVPGFNVPEQRLEKAEQLSKDETFINVEGALVMNFRDRKVEVCAGEMIVIPKGVEHKPSSEDGYKALLIEPEGVANTGNVQNEITIAKVQWV
jgi:uncharacterized RmlC-like cupin family protein